MPGDVVALRVGDVVPADLRLIEATRLECDEAVLTGESMPVEQDDRGVCRVAARRSTCRRARSWARSSTRAPGAGVVVATGTATAFGRIAVGLSERQAETAFQVGLRDFSRLLVRVAGVLTVSIFVINVALSRPLIDALLFSLAIAIGITPQLLPAIVSVSLSSGSRALARKRVLVKRLVTIEDLGNIEVLFTDKTGTLTEGAITFHDALDPGAARRARPCCWTACSATRRRCRTDGPVGGNALDVALLGAPEAAPLLEHPDGLPAFSRLGALPFDHDRQLASVVVRVRRGAPCSSRRARRRSVLARCADVPDGSPGGARAAVRRRCTRRRGGIAAGARS